MMLGCLPTPKRDDSHWAKPIKDALTLQEATGSTSIGVSVIRLTNKRRGATYTFCPVNPSDPSSMDPVLHGTTTLLTKHGLHQSMEQEFKNSKNDKCWSEYKYVVHELASERKIAVNGKEITCDKGHHGMSLKDFANMDRPKEANLSQAEVAALRLYSSLEGYCAINDPLKTGENVAAWSTSISMVTSALLKLSVLSPPKQHLYRGIPGAVLADEAVVGSTINYAGFTSFTSDPNVAATYSGNTSDRAVILCAETTFTCRAGCISDLTQFEEDSEWTFPPFTAMELLDIEEYGKKTLVKVRPTLSAMRHYTNSLRYPWSSPQDPLTWEEHDLLEKALEESLSSSSSPLTNTTSTTSSYTVRETKFSSYASDLVTGVPKTAALGLETYMKQSMALPKDGVSAIEKEFERYGTETDKKWFKYIMYEPASRLEDDWGIRDDGRDGVRLNWFHQHENAKIAGLTLAHVLALRLYTCPVFLSLNNPLRKFLRDESGKLVQPLSMANKHNFPITIAFIDDGIRKLRAVEAEKLGANEGGGESDELILWRGMKNMKVPEEFIKCGGVEMAPMSTSVSIQVASHYALKGDANMIFRIVSKNFMDRGANIEFLSCFPKEQEYLFAPLTFLSPTGRSQWVGNLFVIEVTPRL
mmetsp:Transcript_10399/g.15662  ORF Transcript_10399/g.15662 Transcript_10399/m.15662 type:complete len:642 (+) Transcript_10399:176-2101(+)